MNNQNSYICKIKTELNKNIEKLKYNKNIYICAYTINTYGKYPFLQYLLSNNGYDPLSLPLLPCLNTPMFECCQLYLSRLLNSDHIVLNFDGYIEYEEKTYVFFDLTDMKLNIDDIYRSSLARFALMDEIINHKHICHIPINPALSDFFSKHDFLCFLYDIEYECPYEIPVVGFVGKPTMRQTQFTFTFGENIQPKPRPFGPYFYFTDFTNAIIQGGWSSDDMPEYRHHKLINSNGKYIQGGIVRFALFTERIHYVENRETDKEDASELKQQLKYNQSEDEIRKEALTNRITDYDGLWSTNYDSLYVGMVELDDGTYYKDGPLLVIKNYAQQIPLSYHYINTSMLENTFNPNLYYTIL